MIFKIFTAKRAEVEIADTGTYADGLFPQAEIALLAQKRDQSRSAHERDYGAGRKAVEFPFNVA